jgi:hypothetical protein
MFTSAGPSPKRPRPASAVCNIAEGDVAGRLGNYLRRTVARRFVGLGCPEEGSYACTELRQSNVVRLLMTGTRVYPARRGDLHRDACPARAIAASMPP